MPSRPTSLEEQEENDDADYGGDDSYDAFGHGTFQLESTLNSTNAVTLGKVTDSRGKSTPNPFFVNQQRPLRFSP